jgi:hypothetical protein
VKEFAGSDAARPEKGESMKAKSKQQDESFDAERFRLELARKLDRLVAEVIDGWSTCENPRCGRAKRCASPRRECIAKWQKSRPPHSPEEIEKGVQDLKLSLDVRKRLGEGTVTAAQLEKAIHEAKAARRAAMPAQAAEATPAVVEETKLAPEQQARIDRAWNDHVKEQDRARERGPRITQL